MQWVKQYKLTLVVILLILVAILMPGDSVPSVGIPGMDKLVHFGMFFTLSGTFCLEYVWQYKCMPHMLHTFFSLFIFAFMTEVMQLFAVSRSFDLKDLVADTIGFVVAALLWKAYMTLIHKKKA
ncbi:MAG: VanZ family protein [Clostridiales bacterium]|nr:VanZ family protein [Clostridiales bacterium]